jgi:hypothetical protein
MHCVRTRSSPPTRTLRGERFWPVSRFPVRRVALPPGGFRSRSSEFGAFHRELGIPVRRGRGRYETEQFYVRFCFPHATAADAFRGCFGGERLSYTPQKPRPGALKLKSKRIYARIVADHIMLQGDCARAHPRQDFGRGRNRLRRVAPCRPCAELFAILVGHPPALITALSCDVRQHRMPTAAVVDDGGCAARLDQSEVALNVADVFGRALREKSARRTRLAGQAQRAALAAFNELRRLAAEALLMRQLLRHSDALAARNSSATCPNVGRRTLASRAASIGFCPVVSTRRASAARSRAMASDTSEPPRPIS